MKKIYIIPAVKSIRLDAETLIALSGGEISETPQEGLASMSNHRRNIWGEEY